MSNQNNNSINTELVDDKELKTFLESIDIAHEYIDIDDIVNIENNEIKINNKRNTRVGNHPLFSPYYLCSQK